VSFFLAGWNFTWLKNDSLGLPYINDVSVKSNSLLKIYGPEIYSVQPVQSSFWALDAGSWKGKKCQIDCWNICMF